MGSIAQIEKFDLAFPNLERHVHIIHTSQYIEYVGLKIWANLSLTNRFMIVRLPILKYGYHTPFLIKTCI